MNLRQGDIIAGFVFLIAAYLLFRNWRGANELLTTVFGGTASLTKTLQGR
jgi:glucose dehydrogenase